MTNAAEAQSIAADPKPSVDPVSKGSYQERDPRLVSFGLRVRQLRVGRGLTQEGLAHEAGLHRTVVGFIERGEREVGVLKLWNLADALDVPVSGLFESLPDPPMAATNRS